MTLTDIITILPLVFLLIWALVLLLVDLWIPRGRKGITAFLAAVGLTACVFPARRATRVDPVMVLREQ